ncbi:PTS glucitol/sorbitol transporter subunit IIC [Streptococcus cuniculi]|uniref:PTS sorbitol transporter subunit IIC n=1 Tax=Streptococcus cuniculi TaxID=1432788 RepID=A0A4Y9JEE4_9STRE|nr:PTS glucitol/sorbitol transporter subunit IIC [Streptococcus cuniculi]MBF0777930.1 PTS glucitol/sorbitol transporter subunit IIC [Streptococcus cuniculi]TFU98225.1 PTS sorbitol transporter subunit IIC [Streptococcus cuniculi]
MKYIEWFGENFIGIFQAGGEQFVGYLTGIVPLLVALLTFTNALIALIGRDKVNHFIRACAKYTVLRYTLMPLFAVLLMTNPMAYTFGQFLKEEEKPAFYDAAVSMVHPVTGLFPYANAGELFVFLGIANGVVEAGYSQGSLAVRYFLAGLVVILIRGVVTERLTKFLMQRTAIQK